MSSKKILNKLLGKFECSIQNSDSENLLCPPYNLTATDLLQIYVELKEILGCSIDEKFIDDGRFATINGLLELIDYYNEK